MDVALPDRDLFRRQTCLNKWISYINQEVKEDLDTRVMTVLEFGHLGANRGVKDGVYRGTGGDTRMSCHYHGQAVASARDK